MKKRIFVLGLDGMPYSLMNELLENNIMPNAKELFRKGKIKKMNSVYPVISSVAWTSYSTGENPGKHGVYGFIDRVVNPFDVYIPTSKDRKKKAIWNILSEEGKKVTVINVPVTYPVERVNGKMISCFLCPDIKKGTYPKDIADFLENIGYMIDPDAWLARTDKKQFFDQIFKALEKRCEVALRLLEEDWDYFHLHIMETDRHMHFFWDSIKDEEDEFHESTIQFYKKLDNYIADIFQKLNSNDSVIVLSDHGFCGIKREVQLNEWMVQEGFLKISDGSTNLKYYDPCSIAYSLLPGRIYINLEGREEKGTVKASEYQKTCELIKDKLLRFTNPKTGENIIDKVFTSNEIYNGEYVGDAPDLIAHPCNGYDLKGFDPSRKVFTKSALNGMHTYENALIVGINFQVKNINTIYDVYNEILKIGKE